MTTDAPRTPTISSGRIALLVIGSLFALLGFGIAGGGGALLWAHETQRDTDGYFTTPTERYTSAGYALTSQEIDLGAEPQGVGWAAGLGDLARVRVGARSADSARPLFVGIGPRSEVEAYLRGVPRSEVGGVQFDPFDARSTDFPGERVPQPPARQDFWVAQIQGPGDQALEWDVRGGRWVLVVMNAVPARGVGADLQLGVRIGVLLPLAIGLLAGGLVLLGGGVTMVAFGARGGGGGGARATPALSATEPGAGAPPRESAGSPLRIEGDLAPQLNRGLWIVKWLLAIPHYIVLVFLWIAFVAMTLVAWVAILATGRYPRGIFEFNVGVMRWTWRVAFYSYSALGTDRYPPFTLDDADYPARLEVDYPAQLSRRLALVKTWLLALPHYVVVAVLGAGTGVGWWEWPWGGWGGGLIGILVLFAAVALLVTGRYPRSIFVLVMGLNRWTYRVLAYAALMSDEYPPFRLDVGGRDGSP